MHLSARVTADQVTVENIADMTHAGFRCLIACREISRIGVAHIHFVFEDLLERGVSKSLEKCNQALRKSFNRPFETHRMAVASKVAEDVGKALAYCSKDGNVQFKHPECPTFTPWVHHTTSTESIVSSEDSPDKPSRFNMLDHFEKIWTMHEPNLTADQMEEFRMSRRAFGHYLIDRLSEADWCPKFRVSNWNCFWSYLATLHWKVFREGGAGAIKSSTPPWF